LSRILKIDQFRRRVFGVALVADEVDRQGDTIDDLELEDASCLAVAAGCCAKVEHAGPPVGRLVASYPLTKQIADALGIQRPNNQSVWLIGMEITDDAVWAEVAAGNFHALSIGGHGERVPA
jgi:hypothetical protein